MFKTCQHCGVEFKVKPSRFDKVSYCSRACMSAGCKVRYAGDGNPNYRDAGARKCQWCSNEYHSYNKQAKYCSDRCKGLAAAVTTDYSAMGRKGGHPKAEVKIRNCTCTVCGTKFVVECGARRFRCDQHRRIAPQIACVVCKGLFKRTGNRRVCCSKTCERTHKALRQRGNQSHRWQGGKTQATTVFRNSLEYAIWRSEVFKRDDYTCQMCNKRGLKLAAHHIKPFAKYRDLALVVANGITLCWSCHHSIKGREEKYMARFFAITDGQKPPSERKLTPAEAETIARLTRVGAPVAVVTDAESALRAIGAL